MSWSSTKTEDSGLRTAPCPPVSLSASPPALPNASLHRHATQEGLGARFFGDIGVVQPASGVTAVADQNFWWHPLRADLEAPGAARMKPATRGRVRQVGRLAGHRFWAERLV